MEITAPRFSPQAFYAQADLQAADPASQQNAPAQDTATNTPDAPPDGTPVTRSNSLPPDSAIPANIALQLKAGVAPGGAATGVGAAQPANGVQPAAIADRPVTPSTATPTFELRKNPDYQQALQTLSDSNKFLELATQDGKGGISWDEIKNYKGSDPDIKKTCDYLKNNHNVFTMMDNAAANLTDRTGKKTCGPDETIGQADISALTKQVPKPDGTTCQALNKQAADAANYALAQNGKPYELSETGPNSFDCSGLTQSAYSSTGINLPRESWTQGKGLQTVPSIQDLQPGDLLVWNRNPNTGLGHVAMFVGNGQMVEAYDPSDNTGPGHQVRVTPVRTDNGGGTFQGFYRPTAT